MTKMIDVKKRLDQQFTDFQKAVQEETYRTDRVLGIHNDKLNKIDGRLEEHVKQISDLIRVCEKQQGIIDTLLEDSHQSVWSIAMALVRPRSS